MDPKKRYEIMSLMYDVLNSAREELSRVKEDIYRDIAKLVEILYRKLAERLGWKIEKLDASVGSFAVAVDFAIQGLIDDLRENPHSKAIITDLALELLGGDPRINFGGGAREQEKGEGS